MDELVGRLLAADRLENGHIDVDELIDYSLANRRKEYERTHMCVVPYVNPASSTPAATEVALEHEQDVLESLVSAVLAVDLVRSAEENADSGQQLDHKIVRCFAVPSFGT